LANTVLLLAQHPETQAKLHAELQQVGDKDELTLANLSHLVYLDHVINESMRLLTIVPVITRKTNGVLKLSDGVILADGCHLGMLVDAMHHSPEIWGDDAGQFRPERFEGNAKATGQGFVPFGEGPRKCIGHRYATLSMKVMLVHLLRNFEFSTALKGDELKWTDGYFPQLVNKHVVEVVERKKRDY
jgi:cytochrome P450